jgi:diguanylate cyclase (GGDEF)-like protein/PAS domain S-box-containing protein
MLDLAASASSPSNNLLRMADSHSRLEMVRGDSAGRSVLILRHAILAVALLCLYLFLSRPEIILISNLGFTAWYPAVGLVFAAMLGVSPRYLPVLVLGDILASLIIYHQPIYSWSVVPAAVVGTSIYALAAYVLQHTVKIDRSLSQLSDVLRYLSVTMAAAIFATVTGVACLVADGTVKRDQVWYSAIDWYIGDAVGLLSIAPFLLIYVFPWIRRKLFEPSGKGRPGEAFARTPSRIGIAEVLEAAGQVVSILLFLWILFGPLAPKQYFYLGFVPIIWIAMRHGVERAVIGLLVLNFGIVLALRFFPAPPQILTQIGFLMLVVSATGLIVGSAVTERRRVGEELNERTIFLNSLVESSPFGIVVQDLSGTVQLCNDAFANLYGYQRSEVVGQNLDGLIVAPESREAASALTAQVNSGREVHQTLSRKRKDASLVDVDTHAIPMIQGGRVHAVYIIYNDISVQVRAAAAAVEHARSLNELVGELQVRTNEMTALNELGSLLQSSATVEEVFAVVGSSGKKLFVTSQGGALYLFKSSRNLLELSASWGTADNTGKTFAPPSCWSLRRGQPHWSQYSEETIRCAHLKGAAVADYLCVPLIAQGDTLGVLQLAYGLRQNGVGTAGIDGMRPSERRLGEAAASQIALSLASLRLRESLRDQSIRDPLTGLFNRRFMQESLDREMLRVTRKNRSLAIIFIDIDHFKRFNDVFGHEAGDEVLRSMADFFRTHFRGDDIICRYGGEEFAIILPESSAQDAASRAELLRVAARNLKLKHNNVTLDPVTLSAGIAGYPEHASSAGELLQVADACLYEAKRAGRDRIILANAKLPVD